jgi:hypothetical protein
VNDDGWDSGALEDMLEVRFKRGLRSTVVGITPGVEGWELRLNIERMKALKKEGLVLRLVKRSLKSEEECILMGYAD